MSQNTISLELLERALKVIPGGVNSPVRAFKNVDSNPLFIQRGEGPYVYDADGRQYIDYVASWGPLILGHNSPIVRQALEEVLERGTSFGAPTDLEVEFAEAVVDLIPSLDMVRFVSSGTEACMTAARLARGYTGREYILKFNGCYHGHADFFLVKAGSGVATLGISGSPGVPEQIAERTLSVEFNDLQLVEDSLKQVGPEKVAAIIIEPVPGNMGLIEPVPGYLQGLREICTKHGIQLIFDEVMCGFRVGLKGAGERFGVTPDLSVFGKVIGGGLPVAAFGGRREVMEKLAPSGPVYQAGTLSGNPLGMAAGLAVLKHLIKENPYPALEQTAESWVKGIREVAQAHQIPVQVTNCGSMVGLFFSETPVRSFAEAQKTDIDFFKKFFNAMLAEGVYLAPSAYEAGFISTEHSQEIIEQTISAADRVFGSI